MNNSIPHFKLKRNYCLIFFLLISWGFFLGKISLPCALAAGEAEQEIKLYVGQAKILSVSSPKRVAVGNPEIADITDISKNEMTLGPKAPGSTTLVIWDSLGERSYKIKVLAEDIQELQRRMDNLLKALNFTQVSTKTAEDEGKVLLLGRVKSTQDRERIYTALGALKDKTIDLIEIKEEESAVDIDVQVLEISQDATKTLGFTMPASVTASEPLGRFPLAMRQSMDAIFHVFDWPRSTFQVRLDALVQEGKARILSQPRITCQSGKEAELIVGGEKPIFSTDAVTGGGSSISIEYKEYGIKLNIKPTITKEEQIKLALKIEVSEVEEAETIGNPDQPSAKAYPLKKRNASTELLVNNGQTFAIGGLIKQKTEEDVRRTAGLSDVPIIGLLFRKKTTRIGGGTGERGNTELFIIMTPTIIRSQVPGEAAAEETRISKVSSLRAVPRPSADILDPVAIYARFIQGRILEKLTYPQLAQDAGFQGTVTLSLYLSSLGELLEVSVKNSSGYKLLDENALTAAKTLFPYPPFPASIKQQELRLDIPIDYRLD